MMITTRSASLLAVVASLLLGGCASFQPSPVVLKNQVEPVMRTQGEAMTADRYYQAGRSAMRSGDLRGARKFFSLALLQDPNYIDAINAMAAILTVQGRYADSLELMRQAVERAPDDAMYRRNLERVETLLAREREREAGSTGPVAAAGGDDSRAKVASPDTRTAGGDDSRAEVGTPDTRAAAAATAAVERASVMTIGGTGPLAHRAEAATVVEVAPNVYRLQAPEYQVAGAGQRATSTVALSAPWMRNAESRGAPPAAPLAAEVRGKAAPTASLTTVSYKREAQAPAQLRVMVTNGMGREGWAARHAGLLGAMGMTPARITNYRHYGVQQTMIRFRAGLREEVERITGSVATLASARLVEDESLPEGIDLQVILGRDSQPTRQGPTT